MSWTMKDTLLRCGPWEILPDDRPKLEAAARKWANDERLTAQQRAYIRRIWLPPEVDEPEPLGFVFPEDAA